METTGSLAAKNLSKSPLKSSGYKQASGRAEREPKVASMRKHAFPSDQEQQFANLKTPMPVPSSKLVGGPSPLRQSASRLSVSKNASHEQDREREMDIGSSAI